MKNKIYMLSCFLTIGHLCLGQANELRINTTKYPAKILCVLTLQNKPPLSTENLIISPVDIDTLYGITDKALSEVLKVSQIWVVRPRPNTLFLSFNAILNLYHINIEDRTLMIKIDDNTIDYPETIMAEENEIVNVEVIDNKMFKFINIKTRHPGINKKRTKTEILIH